MLRVLIIDDTRAVHAFIKGLLQKIPEVKLESVFDGSEAIPLLQGGAVFDLILLDWEMPVFNGPRTFDEMKKQGFAIPVIMMTTKNQPSDIERMLKAGVAEYMMKPFTLDILIEKIESVSGRSIVYAA